TCVAGRSLPADGLEAARAELPEPLVFPPDAAQEEAVEAEPVRQGEVPADDVSGRGHDPGEPAPRLRREVDRQVTVFLLAPAHSIPVPLRHGGPVADRLPGAVPGDRPPVERDPE